MSAPDVSYATGTIYFAARNPLEQEEVNIERFNLFFNTAATLLFMCVSISENGDLTWRQIPLSLL